MDKFFFAGGVINTSADSRPFVKVTSERTVYKQNGITVDICLLSDGRWAVAETRAATTKTKYFSSESAAQRYCRAVGFLK